MRDVAVDVAAVVQEVVVRGHLPLLVQAGRPLVELEGTADEVARSNHGVGVKRREKELAIEAIHSPAEPDQAIEDLLPVEQMFESGELFGIDALRRCAAHG